ncbi:NusB antitermination factor [[Clostridium] cellulosi]|jgi:transcription antitermination factor NusB|uniref:Transcription antitermination protein NusB n=1 Tax=[Clostridium] cellulosi TaxID=29343 RepID=A0A078KNQ4_9FIRM|nr:NusB antitermination factor [[Clostridium] cellulosi]
MTRREAREQALSLIFEHMFNDEPIQEILSLAKDSRDLEPDSFALQLVQGVYDNIDDIDREIEKYSIGWSKKRLSRVVLSILRMAIYEINYIEGIPSSVTINEAVELAKKYGGDGDSAFINGLLGALVRSTPDKDNKESSPKVK